MVLICINFSALFPRVSRLLHGTSGVFTDFKGKMTGLQYPASEMVLLSISSSVFLILIQFGQVMDQMQSLFQLQSMIQDLLFSVALK